MSHCSRLTRTATLTAALLALLAGCRGPTGGSWWAATTPKPPGPWVVKPSERMESLRRVARDVDDSSAEQQAYVAGQLVAALPTEPDPLIRIEVIRTLAEFPGDVAASAIAEAVNDGDEDVRAEACKALGKRGSLSAIPVLSQRVAHDDELDVRLAATQALGEIPDPASVPALLPALEHSDPSLQLRAVESMRKITGREYGNDVSAWRELARGGNPPTPSLTLASRVRSWLY